MTKLQKLPTEEARKAFAELLNGAQFRDEHTEITRHNKPAGYLVPPAWYDTATSAIAEVKALRKELAELRRDTPEAPHAGAVQEFAKPPANVRSLIAADARHLAQVAAERAPERVAEYDRIAHTSPYGYYSVVEAALKAGDLRKSDLES